MIKEEKEFKWIINILSFRKFSNGLFTKTGGSLKDFEECANDTVRDKEFAIWFKNLVNKKIINFSEYKENNQGNPTKIYILDERRLKIYLDQSDIFKRFCDVFTVID